MTTQPPGDEAEARPVRRIGRYQVEAVIGTGAFATVYRAVDERLEDTVALKVLAENHSLNVEIRKRFLAEGRVLRRIDSPHVIQVHDLGETGAQQPFLVLEHAERGTLTQRVRDIRNQGWRPAAEDLWSVAEPLARALQAVHRADVVHRDLNPRNVLLTTRGVPDDDKASALVERDERLLVADLGLCKDLALNSGHTSAGGTEGFRPPELRSGPAIIDGRADLWSLSALMVWLVTGSPPDDSPVEPAIEAAGLPAELGEVLERSLADHPDARHSDPTTWLHDLRGAIGPTTSANDPAAQRAPLTPPGASTDDWQPAADAPTDMGTAATRSGNPATGSSGQAAGWGRPLAYPAPPGAAWPLASAVAPHKRPIRKGWRWMLRHSLWLLATLPFGLTTWAGFLYIGLRANHRSWLWTGAGYAVGAIVLIGLILAIPEDAQGELMTGTWQDIAAMVLTLTMWIGGIIHGLVVNVGWLRWRANPPETPRPF